MVKRGTHTSLILVQVHSPTHKGSLMVKQQLVKL